ncbi:CAAX farnesyltransferase (FTase) subunit beta [Blastocladiella emersonii ATCC 22665]|nr:CAAX farnesyltransferase (FTase) subunit beta [Blastocladiella emersonii ATCC 22665]
MRFTAAECALFFTSDEDCPSHSHDAQAEVEELIYGEYLAALRKARSATASRVASPTDESDGAGTRRSDATDAEDGSDPLLLRRARHQRYVQRNADALPAYMSALSASRPWLVYWLLHALDLLSADHGLPEALRLRAATTVLRFQQRATGGFGGGLGQIAHLAPTYAAVHALAITREPDAWKAIDRRAMYRFFMRMKQNDGSFRVSES